MNIFLKSIRTPFRYTFKNAALAIIMINVAVYILFNFTNIIPIREECFALNVVGFVYNKFLWQPLTYMFLHGNFMHLLFNMLGILFFGIQVERALGSKEFVLIYLIVGILSGVFSVGIYYFFGIKQLEIGFPPYYFYYSLVGASGAIYGILFTFAVVFPKSRIFIYGIIPVPAPLLVLIYAVIEFVSQFVSTSNVAHQTHLAGFGFAFLYIWIRMGVNPIKVWRDAFRK